MKMMSARSAVMLSVRNILNRPQLLRMPVRTGSRLLHSLPASLLSPRVLSQNSRVVTAVASRYLHTTGETLLYVA